MNGPGNSRHENTGARVCDEAREWAEWLVGPDNDYGMTPDEEKGTMYVLALLDLLDARRVPDEGTSRDPLEGANCHLCGNTADNFHVSDALWERVGLGSAQACFKCFRIAAWHKGIWPEHSWEVSLA